MPSTDAAARSFRESPWAKAAILVAVLIVAFGVSRSCGSSAGAVSQEEAVEIARGEIDYQPDGINVRNFPRGIPPRRLWAVKLYTGTQSDPGRMTEVVIDAETGDVLSVRREAR
ncbi:MAG TPA: PepSY domain-containing protein [Gaiellaceae bacterium]|nr:PepSY domain-containing protein [Gaiellaceae bacterium]